MKQSAEILIASIITSILVVTIYNNLSNPSLTLTNEVSNIKIQLATLQSQVNQYSKTAQSSTAANQYNNPASNGNNALEYKFFLEY